MPWASLGDSGSCLEKQTKLEALKRTGEHGVIGVSMVANGRDPEAESGRSGATAAEGCRQHVRGYGGHDSDAGLKTVISGVCVPKGKQIF